jgi:hypothetical protein
VLLDSGATCSCITEEQVVIIVNHTQRMPGERHIQMTDHSYPIVQFHQYRNVAHLRGAEKTGENVSGICGCALSRAHSERLHLKSCEGHLLTLRSSGVDRMPSWEPS